MIICLKKTPDKSINLWYNTDVDNRVNKKSKEELEQYLAFKRRAFAVPTKKGKGSYNRKKFKKGLTND